MTFGSIYKIQFPNGKYYIGLTTTSLEQRRQQHKYCVKRGETQCLYNALRKYEMVDTFELIEIDTTDSLEELCEMEIRYIIEYNSYYMNGKGYNMTKGGEGINGYVHTEEDKQRAIEGRKKYYENNYDARQQASETTKKQFENPEARQQHSEIRKKFFEDNPNAGKEHGERMKKYYQENPNAGKEQSERSKKYYQENPNAGKEQSERMKKYFENPVTRQKILDIKGKNNPFDIFSKDGTFIKTFAYQIEAKEYLQKEHNITSTIKISEVLSGTRHSSAGFVFKYK